VRTQTAAEISPEPGAEIYYSFCMLGSLVLQIRYDVPRAFLGGLLLWLGLTAACGRDSAHPSAVDLDGHPVAPLDQDGSRAVVLLFVRTDCPIANRYAPEVRRLQERFSAKGVVFWLVYPDPDESPETIRKHMGEYGYTFGALRDPKHELVRLSKATVTPEAAVFVPSRNPQAPVYHGRIDDRNVDFGQMRPAATSPDLDNALTAVLTGKPVARPSTEAVGCFIPDIQ
jgi:peroxiredoxin